MTPSKQSFRMAICQTCDKMLLDQATAIYHKKKGHDMLIIKGKKISPFARRWEEAELAKEKARK